MTACKGFLKFIEKCKHLALGPLEDKPEYKNSPILTKVGKKKVKEASKIHGGK